MKILILSPLFPPDTGTPADYVKELATRLSPQHETALLIYGYLPETVPGVTCTAIDKRAVLPLRLWLFTKVLLRSNSADLVLVQNAPSTELPLLISSLFRKTPYVLLLSDPRAVVASSRGWYKLLHAYVAKRAHRVISVDSETVYKKAELLPFEEFDAAREARRITWWNNHLNTILS